ncbi:hypothetical protein BS78_K284900 [Paspalum vaginatum]|uniref:Rx N-terminal domain-containing protein n=1 Tax=Paspalum vaginatum TaxID=158149 RepID=A0A9W7XAR4_9POAL|nr:hypothetical protein BS78_K284900 [Paspalum vaginatum]KAJ1255127.1 hypothetical protein BS78_K284900 [Paspalum vaginatum]KAJ1255128.1 hypothetical protein BS78_K284900 [Paspalum vaginatum]KAJ1255129.1 hypothetical protein BS78_K284900 [Paspalum vaginatum]KAJ1255130.1 hypothetical protein BS78_K284900 [Paspalum vaginatum]
MAAQTEGAVDALLGLLSTAIKDEAKLLGGVPGDLQFIKDEMDSMNGFLKHLNKMEGVHDDQVRAWMKQVREVSYIAEDCVDRYVRDIAPYLYGAGPGFLYINMIRFFLRHPHKYCKLHQLGKQLAELKLRVREVGERRQRYDVSVPAGKQDVKPMRLLKARQEEEKRETFRRQVLEKQLKLLELEDGGDLLPAADLSKAAVAGLPHDDHVLAAGSNKDANDDDPTIEIVRGILEKCWRPPRLAAAAADKEEEIKEAADKKKGKEKEKEAADKEKEKEAAARVIKMFLCALYVYPYATNQELKKLGDKLEEGGGMQEANREQVMIFCYSMLSTEEKSCLQYLTAFLHEKEISRTSMVRRWAAEGLVGKEQAAAAGTGMSGSTTPPPQEAGERCFRELVFRGFVRPRRFSDAGTVKTCVMEEPIKGFVRSITRNENFLLELPAHLGRQLSIREIVDPERRSSSLLSSLPPPPPPLALRRRWRDAAVRHCNLCSCMPPPEDDARRTKDRPMDELVGFLILLPEMYRLNVLDLGGCKGLKGRHLESFGKHVACLRYLSLRNTDVSRLEVSHINRLTLLETPDIRGTRIPPSDTKKIYLPNLKHLLADRPSPMLAGGTMQMPDRIGQMKNMETLSHVQVSKDGAELEGVVRLRSPQQLRKLGVVVHGNQSTAEYLGRVLYALSGCLRSLSIWVVAQTQTLDIPSMPPESSRVLENLEIKGKMTSFPSWIGGRDKKLANVTLRDTEINGGEALRRLGSVPSLRCLKLVGQAFSEQALVFKHDVPFEALKFLVIEGNDAITSMAFDADGAAPNLEKIVWAIGSGGGGSDSRKTGNGDNYLIVTVSGIHNLPSLKEIELRGDFKLPNLFVDVESRKKATDAHPNKEPATQRSYSCRYVSSDGNNLIHVVEVAVVASKDHPSTSLSLPVRVINQQS